MNKGEILFLKLCGVMPFFAHPEHVIIAMLGDENKPGRDIAFDKIMSLRETLTAGRTDTFKETSCKKVQGTSHKRKCNFVTPAS